MDPTRPVTTPTTLPVIALAIFLVPFQAAAEEYAFRGLLPQVIGGWLRSPLWGVVLSLPLFVVGHEYNPYGLASVGLFAATAAWLVWRSGGLEIAIACHTANNSLLFLAQAFGLIQPGDGDLTGLLVEVVVSVITVAAVELLWRYRWGKTYTAVLHPDDAGPAMLAATTGHVPHIRQEHP